MSEAGIQQQIRLALGSCPGVRTFRNNVGAYKLPDGRVLRYGLITGSGDLIGWRSVTITPDMVGQTFAQFLSVEVKTPKGRPSPEQVVWAENVRKAGGIAVIARSVDDVAFLTKAKPPSH
jgi:hypothetical protein